MDKNNNFPNLQDGVMTHLDIRKEGRDAFDKTSENENKWGVLIGTHLSDLFKQIDAKDEAGMNKTMDSMLAETIKLRNNNVEDVSRMLGEKMANSYSIGFAEGSYDNMKHTIKLLREKIEDGTLNDDPNLRQLLTIMENVATEQYQKAFEGKPLTFFSPTSKK